MAQKWYVVHTYSGFENKVKSVLEERIRSARKEEHFAEILVPAEKVIEMILTQFGLVVFIPMNVG